MGSFSEKQALQVPRPAVPSRGRPGLGGDAPFSGTSGSTPRGTVAPRRAERPSLETHPRPTEVSPKGVQTSLETRPPLCQGGRPDASERRKPGPGSPAPSAWGVSGRPGSRRQRKERGMVLPETRPSRRHCGVCAPHLFLGLGGPLPAPCQGRPKGDSPVASRLWRLGCRHQDHPSPGHMPQPTLNLGTAMIPGWALLWASPGSAMTACLSLGDGWISPISGICLRSSRQ